MVSHSDKVKRPHTAFRQTSGTRTCVSSFVVSREVRPSFTLNKRLCYSFRASIPKPGEFPHSQTTMFWPHYCTGKISTSKTSGTPFCVKFAGGGRKQDAVESCITGRYFGHAMLQMGIFFQACCTSPIGDKVGWCQSRSWILPVRPSCVEESTRCIPSVFTAKTNNTPVSLSHETFSFCFCLRTALLNPPVLPLKNT